MNGNKLTDRIRKAGMMAAAKKPDAARELKRIAQEIDQMMQSPMDQSMPSEQPSVDMSSLNPNIKNFATPTAQDEKPNIHKITINFEVPKGMGITDLMNELIEAVKDKPDIKITGYNFANQ